MKKLFSAFLLFLSFLPGQTPSDYGLQIPTSHPRLWWTSERLVQARAWYAANPFTPRSDDYLGHAFRYLMTGEASYARTAINYAMGVTFDTSGVASNDARWYGETVILTYDWCYDQMTPTERATLRDRWNGYLEVLRLKFWGGPTMPQSNYFWGYLRNQIEWSIATWYENPAAATLLQDALVTRWQNSFLPHTTTEGRGGVLNEGLQYGRTLVDYATVPFVSAGLLGRNLFGETNFFREAVYYIIYNTPPGQTIRRADGRPYWEMFPFSDDQFWRDGGSAAVPHWANFMISMANLWRDQPVGQHARRWRNLIGSTPARFVAATDPGGPELDLSGLPLDYFAPGAGFLYTKNGWTADSTVALLQLGFAEDDGSHGHSDYGSWQMWRGGRWLSRETTGYTNAITGYNGTSVETIHTVAHNSILVGGAGFTRGTAPVIRRVESRPEYTYGATDLTPSYRSVAAVSRLEREYLFVRPLETMLVFDRVESTTASPSKTFLVHFEQQPVVDGTNTYLGVNGNQALRVTTLVPSTPVYRVINEGGTVGQYRLEVETGGQNLSYFLHVLQARDANGQNLTASVNETATQYIVTLQHPSRGHARIVFDKGREASGGGFAYSSSAPPSSVNPLLQRVQGIQVTNSGPVWEALSGTNPTPLPGDTTAPVISGVAVSPAGSTSATVSWTTNEPADGQVEYGTTTAYGQLSALSGTMTTARSISLAGLLPGTTYHCRVRSRDAAGNLAVSGNYTFTTGASSPVQYTITASAGAGGTISPSGAVTVSGGASQTFTIAPNAGYAIASVAVNGTPVGAVSSYTFSNVAGNQTIAASFTAAPVPPPPPPSSGATIAITVYPHAGNGPANLASNALPFRPGVVSDPRNVRLLDGTTEVPMAVRVLATWPQDNSIRSLLLQFSAPFTTASKPYTVQVGTARTTADPALVPVTWDLPMRIFTLPASYLSQSLVFWEQRPLGESGFPAWETKQLTNYYRIETVGTAPCVRDDQYYDTITTTYQLYARTGDLRYLVNARRWALHHRRDQIYLSGTNIGHPQCTGNYLNNTRYTFPQGLINDFFMFGDEEARRVSGVVVDNFYMPHADGWYYRAPNTRGMWTEREPAFALIGILAHYEGTGNATYLNRVRERVASLHRMQVDNGRRAWVHNLYDHDPSEGCAATDYGSSPWMSGLLLEAVIKYHKLTGDPIARESVLMALDDLRARYLATRQYAGNSFVYLGCPAYSDGAPDLDNLIAHAFAYGHLLTGSAEYRNIATNLFNTSVQNGVTASAKHYNQQFRSSGHMVAYLAGPSAPGDTTAPQVAVTSPAPGQTVSGTITATATASDDVGVAGVQFLVDGQPYGVEDTTAPYTVQINTAALSSGSHTIAARARDAAGNVTTSTAIPVTVGNSSSDTAPPQVAVTSPTPGQTVSGTITITATATDDVGVVGVQFLVNGNPYGSEVTAAPYSLSIDSRTASDGTYTIAARARDAAGNATTSASISITVNNNAADTTAPTVTISSPAAGQTVSGTITATASASDNIGVAGVQFLVDGQPYGVEGTASPYAISIDTRALSNGSHTIAARARDAAGNAATSPVISVTVSNTSGDNTAPQVAVTSPAPGQTVSGTITVTVSASDNVGVVGVQFLVNSQPYGAEDTTNDYSVTVDTRALPNGTHTLAARARDAAGNTAISTVVTVTVNNTTADTTAPTVAITSPASGQTVSGTVVITAAATDNVAVAGVQFLINGNAYGPEDTAAPYSLSIDSRTVSNGTYTLTARARDAAGNAATSAAVTVTVNNTAADTTAPTVAISSPAAGQSVSGSITATASASDNVGVAGVQFLVDGQPYGAEVTAAPYAVSIDTRVLSNGSHTIAARARDAAGNAATSVVVSVTVSNTVSRDTTAPSVSITSPSSGQTVSGSVTLTAAATDNVGVAGVQFLIDGNPYGTEITAAPYAVSINTRGTSNGTHTIAARARDAAGNVATSPAITITVNNPTGDTTAPVVQITYPGEGRRVNGWAVLEASATDNVGVAGVQFYIDGRPVGVEATAAPYRVWWDSKTAATNSDTVHTVYAVARDAAGNRSTSPTVTFWVKGR